MRTILRRRLPGVGALALEPAQKVKVLNSGRETVSIEIVSATLSQENDSAYGSKTIRQLFPS